MLIFLNTFDAEIASQICLLTLPKMYKKLFFLPKIFLGIIIYLVENFYIASASAYAKETP